MWNKNKLKLNRNNLTINTNKDEKAQNWNETEIILYMFQKACEWVT